jgi:hypothetical protein
MSLINNLCRLFKIPLYIVEYNPLVGAVKHVANDNQIDSVVFEKMLFNPWTVNREIKRLDTENAVRIKEMLQKAYPEMIDELI